MRAKIFGNRFSPDERKVRGYLVTKWLLIVGVIAVSSLVALWIYDGPDWFWAGWGVWVCGFLGGKLVGSIERAAENFE